jgi:uncharacterized membrane protein YkgB
MTLSFPLALQRRRPVRKVEGLVSDWVVRHRFDLTRVSLGIVFFWFGALKLFAGLSPAEELAGTTVSLLTGGFVNPDLSVPLLGGWECLMGFGLLSGRLLRLTLISLFLHMAGTVTPVFLLPDHVFANAPFVLTLEGQYIVKNLVLISAALVVGSSIEPTRARAHNGGR